MSDWGVSSGLVDKFTGTIDEAKFLTDLEYRDGEVPLLSLTFVNIENDEGVNIDELTERWSIGNGWDVVDGGKGVEREDGNKNKKFHKRTKYGMMISAIMRLDGTVLKDLQGRGSPTEAGVWEGMRFTIERQEVNGGPEIGTYEVLIPTSYHGIEGGSGSAKPAKKAAAKKAAASGSDTAARIKAEVALKKLAKDADDYDSFLAAALDVEGVTDNDELLAKVTDEDGLYAEARAA